MKKSTKILLYGSIISILYIIICVFIQKEEFINKSENLISTIDNTPNSHSSKEIESVEEIKPSEVEKNSSVQIEDKNLIDENITDIEDTNIEKNITKSDTNSSKNITIDNNIKQDNTKDNIEVAQDKIVEILKEQKINFYRNRAKLTPQSKRTLKEVIAIIKDIPNIKIDVRGYTDASGKKAVNKWISKARAKSVKLYLGSHGINPEIIDYKGFGEDDLLYKDKPYSPLNRRVEIEIKRR